MVDVLSSWLRRRAARRPGLPGHVRAWLEAPWPADSLPWRAVPYTVIDLETTGLDPRVDAIIAVGLVDVSEGRVDPASAWESLVSPDGVPLRPESVRVHGLTAETLAGAPPLAAVLPTILGRLRGRVFVAHVGAFDRPFLDRALRRSYGCGLHVRALDTARMAVWLEGHPQLARHSAEVPLPRLCDLAARFGVATGRPHDALSDALACAEVLLRLAARLEGLGHGTLADLRRVG